MGTTYSLPGEPSSYIQVNEVGLKNCLYGANGTSTINNCISTNIVGPTTNGAQMGVNAWNSASLPANPACPTKQHFQNIENVEITSQSKIVMLIVIIITLLVVFVK